MLGGGQIIFIRMLIFSSFREKEKRKGVSSLAEGDVQSQT